MALFVAQDALRRLQQACPGICDSPLQGHCLWGYTMSKPNFAMDIIEEIRHVIALKAGTILGLLEDVGQTFD